MFTNFNKATEPNGKSVRAVRLLDYSGKCEHPFDLPLREHLLWSTAKYADLHGEFPDGEERFGRMQGRYGPASFRHDNKDKEEELPPSQPSTMWRNNAESGEALIVQAELERIRLACGRCHWCANQRKRRWERAATGWIENSALTCFSTLTFGDEYFSSQWNQWIDKKLAEGEAREGESDFDGMAWFSAYTALRSDRYAPADPEHESFMRKRLQAERQKMFKRLRHALEGDERFEGIKLKAHLSVFEVGDLRGRLHMHFIAHFDIGDVPVGTAYSRLRKFFKKNWHGHGIGFVDVQHATPDSGVETARYLTNYLLAYQEEEGRKRVGKAKSRLACSIGYRPRGTDLWFAGRPSLIPGGSLRPADPVPPELRDGFPPSGGDADQEDLQLSEASSKLSFAEMPHEFRVLAEKIAKANLAWRDGDLWPGWSAGYDRPEDDLAELPPGEYEFAQWLLSLKGGVEVHPEPSDADRLIPPWLAPDCSSAHPDSVNITGRFQHPRMGGYFSEDQWLSFTNSERVALALGHVPPWWKDGETPPIDRARLEKARNFLRPSRRLDQQVQVLGKTLSQRAIEARGLDQDTLINRKGEYKAHPDDKLRTRRRLVRNPADGSLYDAETGEIIVDVTDIVDD
jgi:hypothetical protein